jgi:serine/threonine protein kinase
MSNQGGGAHFIGRYHIVGTIGQGSMGVVYKAMDPVIHREVALKTLYKGVGQKEGIFEKIRQEARLAGKLRHQNIVRVYEVNTVGEHPYVVMDLVEAHGLDTIIVKEVGLEWRRVLKILEQVASALDYAHREGVIHRDIKPANILIGADDVVSIVDFGVAALIDSFQRDKVGEAETPIVGSPGYMSPEQIRNESLDARSDLFSLGVVAFEMLFGTRPFPGKTAIEVIAGILNKEPRSTRSIRSELPEEVDLFFQKALAKNRSQRFQSGTQFIQELRLTLTTIPASSSAETLGLKESRDAKKNAEHDPHQELLLRATAVARAQQRFRISLWLSITALCGLALAFLWTVYMVTSGHQELIAHIPSVIDRGEPVDELTSIKLINLIRDKTVPEARYKRLLQELAVRPLPESRDLLVQALLDGRTEVRILAIHLLVSGKYPDIKERLMLHSEDQDSRVRLAVFQGIATIADPVEVHELFMRKATKERNSEIREFMLGFLKRNEKNKAKIPLPNPR